MTYANYTRWKTTPIQEKPYLSVIIPAYNEEERIIPTIGAITAHLCNLDISWEMIIVDDGSSDNTVQLVRDLELVNLRLLIAPENGGKGHAVRRGMLAARGQYLLFSDADNATPIEEIDKLLHQLTSEGFDIAIGSRAIAGADEAHRSLLRRIMSGGLRLLVRNIFHIGVQDTQCGFKLFTREAARCLYINQTIMGFSFDLETLYLAQKFGYRVIEVPVTWFDAPGSKVNTTKEIGRFIRDLFKIKWNDWQGVYETKTENCNCDSLPPRNRFAQ